jgi:hypothetical protein
MKPRSRFLAILHAAVLLAAFGCGDEDGGGCGPAKEKKKEEKAPASSSGNTGSTSRGGDIQIQDKKGRVPKGYQRPTSAYEPKKAEAMAASPSKPAPAPPPKAKAAPVRVIRRKVDGVADRVELQCRILASSPDHQCSGAVNYAEIKERCCPGGLVEQCTTTMDGVLIIGRGCDPATR